MTDIKKIIFFNKNIIFTWNEKSYNRNVNYFDKVKFRKFHKNCLNSVGDRFLIK